MIRKDDWQLGISAACSPGMAHDGNNLVVSGCSHRLYSNIISATDENDKVFGQIAYRKAVACDRRFEREQHVVLLICTTDEADCVRKVVEVGLCFEEMNLHVLYIVYAPQP